MAHLSGLSFSIRSTGFHKNRWFPGEHTAVESKYTQEIQLEENEDSSLANKTLRIGGCRDLWCSIAKHHDTIWLWLTVRHGKSTHAIKFGKPSISTGHRNNHGYFSHNQMAGLCQCETESQSPGPEALFEALFWLALTSTVWQTVVNSHSNGKMGNLVVYGNVVKCGKTKYKYMNILVGGIPTPLRNMSSSVGMMKFPIYGNNKSHVPNHQPAYIYI